MNSIISAIGWHMVGAASAASFYAPIGKVKKWSWETTWAVDGVFSWVLLPIAVSYSLLPDFRAFYASLDSGVVLLRKPYRKAELSQKIREVLAGK